MALGESDMEGENNQKDSSSDQDGFDEDGMELPGKKANKNSDNNLVRDDEEDYYQEGESDIEDEEGEAEMEESEEEIDDAAEED